jgi:hypothetical protein
MKPFHYNQDPLYAVAASILAGQTVSEDVTLEEGVEDIAANVANFKKGDKTNFGVVTDVSSTSITFKAKDLPVTKIAFNQRKMGSKDFVLDKLIKLKESEGIKEGEEDFYSQKMIKNQLNTIVRNSTTCLQMIEAGRKFPEWAQSEIAVAEDGIVSVTEFMESHQTALGEDSKLDEAQNMGIATIVDTGNKSGLDGKKVNIFHKFDDGRINVQYKKSDRKGDVRNLTLNKGQYKLDEA